MTDDVQGMLARLDLAIGAGEWTGDYNAGLLRDARALIQQQAEDITDLQERVLPDARSLSASRLATIAALTEERDRLTAQLTALRAEHERLVNRNARLLEEREEARQEATRLVKALAEHERPFYDTVRATAQDKD